MKNKKVFREKTKGVKHTLLIFYGMYRYYYYRMVEKQFSERNKLDPQLRNLQNKLTKDSNNLGNFILLPQRLFQGLD